jgi:hypothetical protein
LKLRGDDPVIRVVVEIDPKIDGSIRGADRALHWKDFAFELRALRSLLQNAEVERLRLEGKDLPIGFCSSCQNRGGVADVGSDVQNVSLADKARKGLHEILQVVFDVAFVEEISGLE